jgi:hypothetical protein
MLDSVVGRVDASLEFEKIQYAVSFEKAPQVFRHEQVHAGPTCTIIANCVVPLSEMA